MAVSLPLQFGFQGKPCKHVFSWCDLGGKSAKGPPESLTELGAAKPGRDWRI